MPFFRHFYCSNALLGVQNPAWFDFQSLADTFSWILLHGHICKFLGVWEEFIFMWKILLMPEYFLEFFAGLVGIYIKIYFMLKYARYSIKPDYLNLIFWILVKIFYLICFNSELGKLEFLVLSFELFFPWTRGGAETIW